jgi:hypothetical protein
MCWKFSIRLKKYRNDAEVEEMPIFFKEQQNVIVYDPFHFRPLIFCGQLSH